MKVNEVTTFHVLDDVLDEPSRQELAHNMYTNKENINGIIKYYSIPYSIFINEQSSLGTIFRSVNKLFDLSHAVGYERWHHINGRPRSWHVDKDEKKFDRTKEFSWPICTVVYYPTIGENLKGGEFRIRPNTKKPKDVVIQPVTNRMIVFSPNTVHMVQPFEGERLSLIINPWTYEIK